MRTVCLALLVTMVYMAPAQSNYYPIDLSHSQVKFVGHLGGMMDVEGTFGNFWGILKYDETNPEATSITLMIDPSSIQSGNEWRDRHLKNPEFLEVEKYPDLTFQSQSVSVRGSSFEITGTLNLKGEKREVMLIMELAYPPTPDPWGNRRVGFQGEKQFSRAAINMGPTEGFWSGSIADEFEMKFVISASQQNMDRMSVFERSPMKEFYRAAENNNIDSLRTGLVAIQAAGQLEARMVNMIALRLDQHQMPEEAMAVYELNTELFGEDHGVFSNLARAHMDRGNEQTAKQFAQKALEMNPQDALAMELIR